MSERKAALSWTTSAPPPLTEAPAPLFPEDACVVCFHGPHPNLACSAGDIGGTVCGCIEYVTEERRGRILVPASPSSDSTEGESSGSSEPSRWLVSDLEAKIKRLGEINEELARRLAEARDLAEARAASAQAVAPELDVERLARAIEIEDDRLPFLDAGIDSTATPRAVAEQIADRYARLWSSGDGS